MKEITFEYRHGSKTKCHTVRIPSSLSEATPRQFLTLLAFSQGRVSEEEFMKLFFGVTEDILAKLDPWQLYVITEQLRDLWKLEQCDHFILNSIDVKPLKEEGRKSRIGSWHLEAPVPQLKGMSFQQFMTVDQFYQWYAYSGKPDYLFAMVAALYLPVSALDGPLDFFSYDHGLMTETLAQNGDRWILDGIAFNWVLIRAWLSSAYPHLFPAAAGESSDGSGAARNRAGQKPRPASWLAIFDTLVGDDLTRLETYKTLPCMDVIRILNKRIKEQQKAK